MEQHPIPRQITTFQFKLIGFITLNQFLYLLVFGAISYIVFKVFPIPIINILLAAIVAGVGIVFAFIPFNDRPLDLLIKNFLRHLFTPTQYLYQKENPPVYFLEDLYFEADPHKMMAHVQSASMLSNYINQTPREKEPGLSTKSRQAVNQVLQQSTSSLTGAIQNQGQQQVGDDKDPIKEAVVSGVSQEGVIQSDDSKEQDQQHTQQVVQVVEDTKEPSQQPSVNNEVNSTGQMAKKPFFGGVIKSNKQVPLPNILVYMKDDHDKPLRLMKTNPHGVFATFNPLPKGEYLIEPKDPKGSFFFDTMKVNLQSDALGSVELHSRELL